MSQKSYTVLTVAVTLAIPVDKTQAQTLELIKTVLSQPSSPFNGNTIILKPLKRETHYL